ncbi:MAG: hypothetical protein K2W78_11735 [Xanthobacteraceae bacterium]|nr:hypothetical protein [Xanthobacteraceae bacterium]
MAGLNPAIHDFPEQVMRTWITGTSPVMTVERVRHMTSREDAFLRHQRKRWLRLVPQDFPRVLSKVATISLAFLF